jgi:two-component system, chemotaxis family, protein-glutamate methylesterase/glutaminase
MRFAEVPTPAKKRVLIVDDAVVVRKCLADAIAQDPDLEVAATASNGRLALAKFPRLKPDIVLLDIEMPEMDGLATVRELRKVDARVPIIMFSTLTERGATITLEALSAGASDYVTKPSNADAATTSQAILAELIPKIRALCRLPATGDTARLLPAALPARGNQTAAPVPVRRPISPLPVQIVAIGVSTGGPDALAHVIPSLPSKIPVPIVIAQHMPPIFTSLLAARLAAKSAFPVRECVSGEPLTPGCIFLAPGDFHMIVQQEAGKVCLRTHQEAKENFCRPSVDVLFRSVARVYAGRTLAVVLTGMGQDGLKGCELLSQLGARICVQDESTSVVWGMPGFVAKAGLAQKILPLDQIASEIMRATAGQIAATARP